MINAATAVAKFGGVQESGTDGFQLSSDYPPVKMMKDEFGDDIEQSLFITCGVGVTVNIVEIIES